MNTCTCAYSYIPVYTDGAQDGNSGACVTVFPSDTVISMKLPDSASIFTDELTFHIYIFDFNCFM